MDNNSTSVLCSNSCNVPRKGQINCCYTERSLLLCHKPWPESPILLGALIKVSIQNTPIRPQWTAPLCRAYVIWKSFNDRAPQSKGDELAVGISKQRAKLVPNGWNCRVSCLASLSLSLSSPHVWLLHSPTLRTNWVLNSYGSRPGWLSVCFLIWTTSTTPTLGGFLFGVLPL